MQRNYDYVFKICFLGQTGVGKTALLRRYADDMFEDNMLTTIGVDFRFKSINVGGNFIKLQLWDTAGQERFRSVVESYYRDADAIILVYDISNIQSFRAIGQLWLETVKRNTKADCLLFLFANKADKKERIGREEREWCNLEKIRCFQVSAKVGQGVADGINQIVEFLTDGKPKLETEKMVMTLKEFNPPRKKKGCCE